MTNGVPETYHIGTSGSEADWYQDEEKPMGRQLAKASKMITSAESRLQKHRDHKAALLEDWQTYVNNLKHEYTETRQAYLDEWKALKLNTAEAVASLAKARAEVRSLGYQAHDPIVEELNQVDLEDLLPPVELSPFAADTQVGDDDDLDVEAMLLERRERAQAEEDAAIAARSAENRGYSAAPGTPVSLPTFGVRDLLSSPGTPAVLPASPFSGTVEAPPPATVEATLTEVAEMEMHKPSDKSSSPGATRERLAKLKATHTASSPPGKSASSHSTSRSPQRRVLKSNTSKQREGGDMHSEQVLSSDEEPTVLVASGSAALSPAAAPTAELTAEPTREATFGAGELQQASFLEERPAPPRALV